MLGNKKNWRSFTRRLLKANPGWEAYILDHRGHGESPSGSPPHTVAACARDVVRTMAEVGAAPAVVAGHSFGGKVALEVLRQCVDGEAEMAAPRHTWVLDSSVGAVAVGVRADDDSVADVLRKLRDVREPIESGEALIEEVQALGFSLPLARWMTTNLAPHPSGAGYTWAFDLDVAWELFQDYCKRDAVPFLHRLQRNHADGAPAVTLVRAARNTRAWSRDALAAIDARLAARPSDWARDGLRVVELPNAGHWVHMDNPAGLERLMSPSLA